MPTMVTFDTGRVALIVVLTVLAAGCSREQQDWRSAEAADTPEGWARFLEQHPDSELAAQARDHIAELTEARDWQHAAGIATVPAYREFLSRHPAGRRAEDARIRIEAFSLGSAPHIDLPASSLMAGSHAPSGVSALQIATGAGPTPLSAATVSHSIATPGEAAQAAPAAVETPSTMDAAVASVEAPAVPTRPIVAANSAATIASPSDPSGYGVQLGAFGSPASAGREWQRLQGQFSAQLGGLAPQIVLTSTNVGQLYRLQVAAAGEAQARAICNSLKEQAQACVPVLPQNR